MKKVYIFIGIGLLLVIFAIRNFTMDIDAKGHYFVNGIICGIGISLIVVQLLKLRKSK